MSDSIQSLTPETYTALLQREIKPRYAFAAQDRTALRHWQDNFRGALNQALGIPRISGRCPQGPEVHKRGQTRQADHIREEWQLIPEPGFSTPFFLLRPIDVPGPRPLVVTPHGHNKRGRYDYAGITETDEQRAALDEGERDIALQAVRQGYVAIAPQARAFGESRSQEAKDNDQISSCLQWQRHALMFGRTLIGERVWDIMRLIDYAQSRDEIDTTRIAITGNSGGGTISLFAPAIDQRISLAVPSCYFCTFADSIGSIYHCADNYFPGMMELGEMPDVAGLIAPRPFLAVAGREDRIFPIEATQRAFKHLQPIYEIAGARDRCELFIGEGGHRYYSERVWPFMRQHLEASPVVESDDDTR